MRRVIAAATVFACMLLTAGRADAGSNLILNGNGSFVVVDVGSASATHDFTASSAQPIGSTTVTSVSISNSMGAADQFEITNDGCTGQAVTQSTHCTVTARFRPTTRGGKGANLTFTTSAGSSAILMTGTGLAPLGSVAPSSHGFGGQNVGTTSSAFDFTLSNTGTEVMNYSFAMLAGTDFSLVTGASDPCPNDSSLATNDTCTIGVHFDPTSGGAKADSLRITTDDYEHPTIDAVVSGTGVAPPVTSITKTKVSKRTVTFTFTSDITPATFQCELDDLPATACDDGTIKYMHLKPGAHTFTVTATSGGTPDPSPAEKTFKIKRR